MRAFTRRSLLVNTAVLTGAATVAGPASADVPQTEWISPELQALIAAHETAYAAFDRIVHRPDSKKHDRERAGLVEEEALLAVCSYPAIVVGDRRAKAEYLLTVEARGELDLEEHMQAVLRSML